MIAFFALFLCWVNIAIHFPFGMLLSDLCYDVADYTVEQRIQDRVDKLGKIKIIYGYLW